MKKMILMIIVILAPSILFAQRPGMRGQKMHQRRAQIEILRIWKMTAELDLTEEQAGRFFPRLRADDKNIEELEMERQSIFHDLHEEAMKGGMSGEKLDEKIERISEIEKKILKNRANFIKNNE